ncbi:E3 ubiquitin-protein ligase SH3RF2-like [Mytilus edulis]
MDPSLRPNVAPVTLNQDIVNLLKCGICWEYYNLPTVLPCGHTFCLKCIQEIGKHKVNNVNTTKGGVDLSIDCPNCRLKVPISDIQRMKNGVHVNYVLSSIVETILQLKTSFKVDAATNTDSEACFENRINEIQKNLDGIFTAVDKRKSVVNDARTQIDELRCKAISRAATAAATRRQNAGNQNNVDLNRNTVSDNSMQTTWASRLFLPVGYPTQDKVNNYPPNYASDLTDIDPAILSVRTTRTDHSMNGHFYQLSML